MDVDVALDYFYYREAEQFTFYRIPKAMFTDPRFKKLSTDAKVLYGLMLDRMGLSLMNKWVDDRGRVFIYYTMRDAEEQLSCSSGKAVKLFAELEPAPKGVGLIERKKQGQGRPAIIYPKNFASRLLNKPDLQKSEFKTFNNCKSRVTKNRSADIGKLQANNTEYNNTEGINQSIIENGGESDIHLAVFTRPRLTTI